MPSNFIEKLHGEDLLEFHRSAVLATQPSEEEEFATAVPVNLPMDLQEVTPEKELPICKDLIIGQIGVRQLPFSLCN